MEVEGGLRILMIMNIAFHNTTKFTFVHFFADDVKATQNLWLVGDTFVRQFWPMVSSAKSHSAINFNRSYLTDMYNIHPCYPGNMLSTRSLVAKVFNEIVKALNVEEHLPKIIIIMFDMNLIEEINFGGFGCKTIFEKLLQWLTKNLEITLEV